MPAYKNQKIEMKSLRHVPSMCGVLHHSKNELKEIIQHVTQLQVLNRALLPILEPEWRPHCQVAQLNKQTLTLVVDSSYWLTRIRYSTPDLLKKLKNLPEFKTINSIHSFIILDKQKTSDTKKPPFKISKQTYDLLKTTALNTSESKLKKALLNLAEHAYYSPTSEKESKRER